MDTVRILDAWGADVVLVETVGVGQDELEITRAAHSTLVVMAPGLGDGIQAIKAGILEIADVFAVNKADRDGADATVRDLELMVALGKGVAAATVGHSVSMSGEGAMGPGWEPPIVRSVATQNQGVDAVAHRLAEHYVWLRSSAEGKLRIEARLRELMYNEMRQALVDAAVRDIHDDIERAIHEVARRETDPYTASERLVTLFKQGRKTGQREP
jgi:LAO/AO transport system kinase